MSDSGAQEYDDYKEEGFKNDMDNELGKSEDEEEDRI